MKTATILPQAFLELIKDDEYHMALGHLIEAPGFEDYTEFYSKMGRDPEKFVMLDTGLIEGNARPVEELLDKALRIQADEMAINDVFMDHTETLRESHDALQYLITQTEKPRVMAIPQGHSLEDWVECAKEMLRWPIDTIGIPKVLTKLEGRDGRLHALRAIQEHIGDKQVHLLGCWETPLELKIIERAVRDGVVQPVRGVDSAIAYAYAREGIRITDDERPQGAINFAAKECDMGVLKYNIDVWKSEAATLRPVGEIKQDKIIRLF